MSLGGIPLINLHLSGEDSRDTARDSDLRLPLFCVFASYLDVVRMTYLSKFQPAKKLGQSECSVTESRSKNISAAWNGGQNQESK